MSLSITGKENLRLWTVKFNNLNNCAPRVNNSGVEAIIKYNNLSLHAEYGEWGKISKNYERCLSQLKIKDVRDNITPQGEVFFNNGIYSECQTSFVLGDYNIERWEKAWGICEKRPSVRSFNIVEFVAEHGMNGWYWYEYRLSNGDTISIDAEVSEYSRSRFIGKPLPEGIRFQVGRWFYGGRWY